RSASRALRLAAGDQGLVPGGYDGAPSETARPRASSRSWATNPARPHSLRSAAPTEPATRRPGEAEGCGRRAPCPCAAGRRRTLVEEKAVAVTAAGAPRFSKRASATASSRPARQQRTHLPLVLSLARVIDAGLKLGAVVTVAGLRSPAGPAPGRPHSLLAFAPLSLLS